MPASRAKQAATAERRAKLVRLRLEGVAYDDERIRSLGYSSSQSASKDFIRALEERRDDQAAAVSVYRQQENERLDRLLEAAWPAATTPKPIRNKEGDIVGEELDMRAVDTVLRLMDRRAKLNGLDMPVKAELSGPGGGAMQVGPASLEQLRNLIRTAGDPDDDSEEPDPFTDEGDADDDADL
jgi:hypothetical protein